MATIEQQIDELIDGLPIDGQTKVKVEMLQEILSKLNGKPKFEGDYGDLQSIPETIEHSNKYRARTYYFTNDEEKLLQENNVWHSGAQIMADRSTTMNIIINPSDLKQNFETFIDQIGEGALNFINAEPDDFTILIQDGKVPQTENKLDSVSILIWKTYIIIKGDLKDA